MTAIFPCEGLPLKNNRIYMSCEVPEEICMCDPMKVLDQSSYKFYDWLPWDPGGFGHSIVYIKVAQWSPDGGLLISVEFNYAHVILKKYGLSNKYSYLRHHMVWDPRVANCLRTSNLWAARICHVPRF